MNAPSSQVPIRLTSFSHGGGCGCKIAPGVLSEILKNNNRFPVPPQLLVGIETADDAAVYKLNDEQALIATTDFFMPIVDDPHDFGRIAATNAISDVYAMGGTPIMALALVGMPIDRLPVETIRGILEGGESVCAAAGIPIAGGHTIDSVEPIYGLVVMGLVHPARLKTNAGARPGDRDAGGAAHRRPAFEDAANGLRRQPGDRHAHQRQREDRPAAHRVDVADRIGRGDAAEVVRIVDDRHEEIGRRDQGLLVVEPVHGGVVGGLDADQQCGRDRHRRRALEDLREHARGDLAAAAAAMRQRGQAGLGGSGGCVHLRGRGDGWAASIAASPGARAAARRRRAMSPSAP